MKMVVLSDTHIPKRAKSLPLRLIDELKNLDLIIHAGDWQTPEGSPTDKRRQERYSFGILHVGVSLEAEHIFFG